MSPRTPKQFEAIREEKKTLIMDTALEHFAKEGFHSTTITHIAKHAGISKGLMYNYFSSKEELLSAIIERSIAEIYVSFDINRDGFLSEEEFEYFIIRVSEILKDKQAIWRLFFQLLMQNDVREQFLRSYVGSDSLINPSGEFKDGFFVSSIMKMISDYFFRKKEKKGPDYDPYTDLSMFILTMKGFALTYVYMENAEEKYFSETVKRIIELYK
jgi:AcrR family transcriptional regulator